MMPWAHASQQPNGNSIGTAVFAQMTAECPYTWQLFASFPVKIAPPHGDLDIM